MCLNSIQSFSYSGRHFHRWPVLGIKDFSRAQDHTVYRKRAYPVLGSSIRDGARFKMLKWNIDRNKTLIPMDKYAFYSPGFHVWFQPAVKRMGIVWSSDVIKRWMQYLTGNCNFITSFPVLLDRIMTRDQVELREDMGFHKSFPKEMQKFSLMQGVGSRLLVIHSRDFLESMVIRPVPLLQRDYALVKPNEDICIPVVIGFKGSHYSMDSPLQPNFVVHKAKQFPYKFT